MNETQIELSLVERDPDAGDDALTSPVAMAMAGTKALPVPDEDVYPGLGDDAMMKQVYRHWMAKAETTLADAAAACGADPATVTYWAERGDWIASKRRAVKVQAQEEALAIERLRLSRRAAESLKQIDVAAGIRQKVQDTLANPSREVFDKRKGEMVVVEDLSPFDLQQLAAAAKASADIAGRFLGVAEPKAGSGAAGADPDQEREQRTCRGCGDRLTEPPPESGLCEPCRRTPVDAGSCMRCGAPVSGLAALCSDCADPRRVVVPPTTQYSATLIKYKRGRAEPGAFGGLVSELKAHANGTLSVTVINIAPEAAAVLKLPTPVALTITEAE